MRLFTLSERYKIGNQLRSIINKDSFIVNAVIPFDDVERIYYRFPHEFNINDIEQTLKENFDILQCFDITDVEVFPHMYGNTLTIRIDPFNRENIQIANEIIEYFLNN